MLGAVTDGWYRVMIAGNSRDLIDATIENAAGLDDSTRASN